MSTAIVPLDLSRLPVTAEHDEFYAKASKGAKFLRQLQVFSKGRYVDSGQVKPGNVGIRESKDEATDLGKSVDVLPLARRPKAIDTNDLTKQSHDPKSPVFQDIMARSEEKDSGCMWGTSFLVYEPRTDDFYEFFFSTSSARPEAKNLAGFMQLTKADIARRKAAGEDVSELEPHGPLPATIKGRYIQTKKYSWFAPQIHECSTPLSRAPTNEAAIAAVTKFLSAKADEAEKVEEPAEKKKRAR